MKDQLRIEGMHLNSLVASLAKGDSALEIYLDDLQTIFEEKEPFVEAFLAEDDRFGRLRKEAQMLLARYPSVQERPALFGIPVGVKDIFHAHGYLTRAGSKLPGALLTGTQAASVTRLKDEGALIFGKTVTTEFAYFAPGPTRNPHHPDHTPGGSSSGSAAAVGAGMIPLALGTQTIGSITRPASYCGVVGFKPSFDRINKSGVIPLSESLDHVGFFTRDASSAKLVAAVLVLDWAPVEQSALPVLGVPEGPYLEHVSEEMDAHFRIVQEKLKDAGYLVIAVPLLADFERITQRHHLILAAEAAKVHQGWFGEYADHYHSKTRTLIQSGMEIPDSELREALRARLRLREELLTAMENRNIDLWISPSAPSAAPSGLESTGDPIMNLPWTQAGLPTLNLPSGRNAQGLPLGLQLAGAWFGDELLLGWAEGIEKVLDYEFEGRGHTNF